MKKIFLIFPNQLFKIKKQFSDVKNIALIQDSLFFGCDSQWEGKFHCQKIIFHKATMYYYEEALKSNGFDVIHIKHKRKTRTEDNLDYLSHVKDTMVFGKKITVNDVRRLVRRVDWKQGTTYEMYRHDYSINNTTPQTSSTSLYNSNYYVINSDFRIYECIFCVTY